MCDFEPPIHEREVPADLVTDRLGYARDLEATNETLRPRIDGHLLVLQAVVDRLVAEHEELVDRSDLDLAAETRWVAFWEMGGRCLGLANALVAQLRLGYAAETIGTIRVLHEAVTLLMGFLDRDEEALVRRWLAGEEIQPRETRRHLGATAERAAIADVEDLTRRIYATLSPGAHNQRRSFADSVGRPLRRFVTGPHPDFRVRAVYVEFAGQLVEEVAMAVGFSLARIPGGGGGLPLVREIAAVRDTLPIGADVRSALGYG